VCVCVCMWGGGGGVSFIYVQRMTIPVLECRFMHGALNLDQVILKKQQ
jgi:hypothetical protein